VNNSPRIKSITVKGLFNQFDHYIELNQEERITILHGINGVGKTTVLRMINNLFKANILSFNEIPFINFSVEFTNGDKVKVEKKKHDKRSIIELYINKEKVDLQNFDINRLIKRIPWIERINENLFYDERADETISLDDLIKRYGEFFSNKLKEPELDSELKKIPVQFIEATRLLRIEKQEELHRRIRESVVTHTVKIYASELQQCIKNAMAEYAKKTQELEQTFPFRLLETSEHFNDDQSKEYLKERIEDLQNKRQQLREIGLLPTKDSTPLDASSIDSLEERHAIVMNLYVKDSQDKLKVLESLGKKVKLLLGIINPKFQGKELKIDEKKGLIIIGKDGEIDLTQLSSGEQHELVMFYDLIFKVEPNTLVMIDEPELSLHITWQNKFIDELKQIVEQAQFDVLIATHSPTIVGNNSHLMVGLG
jgi:predicted ATP-binding protein involved in virulence